MIMYASKLISSQMLPGSRKRYSDMRRTHCVWVDLHPRPELRNSIFVGRIAFKKVVGSLDAYLEPSELLSITRIGLGVSSEPSGFRLLDILNTLWSGKLDTEERTRELEDKYKIDVGPYLERGLVTMGDLIEELTEYGKHLQREIDEIEHKELRAKNDEIRAENDEIRAENDEIRAENKELRAEAKNALDMAMKERARADEAEARIKEYESKLLRLEKELAEIKAGQSTKGL